MKTELLPTERLAPAPPPVEVKRDKKSALAHLPRLAGYALAAFVAWLLFSTLFRPWVSTSATRAILDAPAILITTPISGTVTAVEAQNGQPITPGQTVAVVKNTTVARDTLTTLLTRRLELQSRADDLAQRIQADQRTLDYANGQYRQYHDASLTQLRSASASLQAQQDAAESKVSELRTKYWRAVGLQRDGAVSAASVSSARAQMEAAENEADALRQSARSASAGIAAAQRGVYVSSGQESGNLLPQLAQRREDLQNSIKNEQAQAQAMSSQLADLNQLIGQEQNRVQSLSDYTIKAFAPGTAQEIVAPVGTQVTAGATLVRATDCSKAGVVAVFPARMAPRLNQGTALQVQITQLSNPLYAHVTQLLPTAPETTQNGYSAPFPYAEDGSVYALAQWDPGTPTDLSERLCTPGRSVMASLR
ncbi:HlyD family efflux transporter periplasmic adaptor subunit [Frateuria defendens]|uniref:HlyD family efflux transporter periplasmic adaptor subunit n=1 Tax=Frateuria defendens TaxID=2219559 RepID=UPI00066FBCE4|nr:HlyD family efflux transporter periplasmic adaptor subunit [Frateuria defendens]